MRDSAGEYDFSTFISLNIVIDLLLNILYIQRNRSKPFELARVPCEERT